MKNRLTGIVEGAFFDEQIAKTLAELAKKYEIRSPDFVGDLFSVFASKGKDILPSSDIIRLARDVYNKRVEKDVQKLKPTDTKPLTLWRVKSGLLQRKMFLENFTQHPIFLNFRKLPPLDAVEKTLELIVASREAYGKMCQAFGGAPIGAMDPGSWDPKHSTDMQSQKHEYKPDHSEFGDIFKWGFYLMGWLDNPMAMGSDMVGCGDSPYYDASNSAAAMSPPDLVTLAKEVAQNDNLMLWELARLIEGQVAAKKRERVSTTVPNDEYEYDHMESIHELSGAQETDLVDDDLLDKKIASGEVNVPRYTEEEDKAQLLHMLVDVSSSMSSGNFSIRRGRVFTNSEVARSVVLAMLMHCAKNHDLFYMRTFCGAPGDLMRARTQKELYETIRMVNHQWFDGGSTDIQTAILQAFDDIRTVDDLKRAEILVISDAQASIDVKKINDLKKERNVKINFLLVGRTGETSDFEKISDRFLKCDFDQGGFIKMIDVLAGSV